MQIRASICADRADEGTAVWNQHGATVLNSKAMESAVTHVPGMRKAIGISDLTGAA